MATSQSPPNSYQILWNSQDIQKFIETRSDIQCDIQGYTHELLALDLASTWVCTSTPSSTETQKRQASSSTDDAWNKTEKTESDQLTADRGWLNSPHNSSNQNLPFENSPFRQSPPDPVDKQQLSVTALGFLLLATITFQNKSDILKQSINRLISESPAKECLQRVICKNLQLKKIGVDGLKSFVNFCVGHCTLCDSDGQVVKDVGILQVWCNVVDPLKILLERLTLDHIQDHDEWTLPLPKPSNVSSLRSYLKQQKAAIYARFHSYDFSHDARYQAGVQQIMRQLQAEGAGRDSNHGDLELEAKLFYFTRFFSKVSKEDYQTWLSHQENPEKKASCKSKKPLLPDAIHSGNASPSVPSTSGLLVGQSEDHLSSTQTSSSNGGMKTKPAEGQRAKKQLLPDAIHSGNASPSVPSTSCLLVGQTKEHVSSTQTSSNNGGVKDTMPVDGGTQNDIATKSSISLVLKETQQHAMGVNIMTTGHDTQSGTVSLSSTSANIQAQSSAHLPSAKTLMLDNLEVSAVQREEASSALSYATLGLSSEESTNTVPYSKCSVPDSSSGALNSDLQPLNSDPAAVNSDPTHTNCDSFSGNEQAGILEQNNLVETNSDQVAMNSDPSPMNSDPPPYPASFLEILRLVESGQEIPGIEVLDIEPTGAPVSESKMEPVKKPWMK